MVEVSPPLDADRATAPHALRDWATISSDRSVKLPRTHSY
jgi:hypothetical protein